MEHLIDRRLMDRKLAKGQIKLKEYQEPLNKLPDESQNATFVKLELEETELSEEQDRDNLDTDDVIEDKDANEDVSEE